MRSIKTGLMVTLLGLGNCQIGEKIQITDTLAHDQEAFRIKTANGEYIYQKEAGGFSSILDPSGNDWIGFQPDSIASYPRSAATSYRGLPNLVTGGEEDGIGHPGFKKCTSRLVGEDKILTRSKSGAWEWSWTFSPQYVMFELQRSDQERTYWFLYEGTVGGKYQPQYHYWGTNKGGPFNEIPDYYFGNEIVDQWQWVYFGDEMNKQVMFLAQVNPDICNDTFSYLGNSQDGIISPDGMLVFGFGRGHGAIPLMDNHEKFLVGFYKGPIRNEKDHQKIKSHIESLIKQIQS